MSSVIFNFGMKYRESVWLPLRFLAELCIKREKKVADRIERELEGLHIKKMSTSDSDRILNNIWRECAKKG